MLATCCAFVISPPFFYLSEETGSLSWRSKEEKQNNMDKVRLDDGLVRWLLLALRAASLMGGCLYVTHRPFRTRLVNLT